MVVSTISSSNPPRGETLLLNKIICVKRLGHHLLTCLFSKCLVLLLQQIHFIQKLRPVKEFLSIEYFCESTNIFLNITFGLIQECVMVTSIFLIKRSSLSNKDLPIRSIYCNPIIFSFSIEISANLNMTRALKSLTLWDVIYSSLCSWLHVEGRVSSHSWSGRRSWAGEACKY